MSPLCMIHSSCVCTCANENMTFDNWCFTLWLMSHVAFYHHLNRAPLTVCDQERQWQALGTSWSIPESAIWHGWKYPGALWANLFPSCGNIRSLIMMLPSSKDKCVSGLAGLDLLDECFCIYLYDAELESHPYSWAVSANENQCA